MATVDHFRIFRSKRTTLFFSRRGSIPKPKVLRAAAHPGGYANPALGFPSPKEIYRSEQIQRVGPTRCNSSGTSAKGDGHRHPRVRSQSLATLDFEIDPLRGKDRKVRIRQDEPKMQDLAADSKNQTERAGFEPAVRCDSYADLANRCFRPLSHLSGHSRTDGRQADRVRMRR